MKKLKKPVSILLSLFMVLSLFSVVPITAFAEEGTYDIDADGNMTLHAGTFTDRDFSEEEYDHTITSVYAEPGVSIEGDCRGLFYNLQLCTSIDLSNADMSGVTSASGMFSQCYICTSITLPESDVCLGASTAEMFYNCNSLESLNLGGCDTSSVTSMFRMFSHCRSIKSLDLKSFNTSSVKNMQEMFYDCTALESVDLSTFNTAKVTNMESMFADCPSIKTLDLSSFDTSKVGTFDYMFNNSTEGNGHKLTTIYVGDKWNVKYSDGSYASGNNMFFQCFNIKGEQGTTYSYYTLDPQTYVGIKRAHVDGGASDPGYLTRRDMVTVRWLNYDGTVLKTERINRGDAASYTGDEPVRPDEAGYHYTFNGWSPVPGNIDRDTDYTAQFTESTLAYNITWKNEDGTVIDTTTVAYGELPAHADAVKPDDGNIVYTFTGWEPAPAAATSDAEYTATFTSEEKTDWGMLQTYIDRAPDNTETNITLTKNYTAVDDDTALSVPENKIITLDLGEFTIDRGLTNKNSTDNGSIITNDGSLTITGTGTLKGGNNYSNGGAVVNNGTLNISGVTITGNNTSGDGGAVYNSGTLNITGGSLYGNSAVHSGGAISAHSGTINISGGELRNNLAKISHGGGIYIGGTAVVNLTGGSVINNRATNSYSQGGGILVSGTLNVSGDPTVTGNTCGKADNVYLRPNCKINITDTLEATASLGITIEKGNGGVITSGLGGKGSADSFFTDKDGFYVKLNSSKEAELAKFSADGVFTGNTLTLNGDIVMNFFIDPTPAGVKFSDIQNGDKEIDVSFSWFETTAPLTDVTKYSVKINKDNFNSFYDGEYLKVSCNIAVAEMSCMVKATAQVNGFTAERKYSVREYGRTVLDRNSIFSVDYIKKHGAEDYDLLTDLVIKMLDYGAKAQKVFNINADDPANSIFEDYEPEYTMQEVKRGMCTTAIRKANDNRGGDDMNDVAAEIDAEYYSTSLIYLSQCTLRHYFTFNKHPEAYENYKNDLNSSKAPFYYIDAADIPAADLDKLQVFTLGGEDYYYSALNFVIDMIESEKATDNSKDLAMALYWYNQAANEFFE